MRLMRRFVKQAYGVRCHHHHVDLSTPKWNLSQLILDALQNIFNGNRENGLQIGLFKRQAEILWKGVLEGAGKSEVDIAFDTPDAEFLTELRHNTYVFAAFKNHQFDRDVWRLLQGEKGTVPTFQKFRDAALEISEDYNVNWLAAEYDTAIATGQTSARWREYQQNADILPYLQYQTAGDERVREDHRLLDLVTRRMDDEFWDIYYPPNGWRCRCDVIQVAGPRRDPIDTPELPEAFQNNPGKTAKLYSDKHPYYKTSSSNRDRVLNVVHRELYAPEKLLDKKKYPVDLNIRFWRLFKFKPNVRFTSGNGAYYMPTEDKVSIGKGSRFKGSTVYKYNTVYHELAHNLHFRRNLITLRSVDKRVNDFYQQTIIDLRPRMIQMHENLEKITQLIGEKPDSFVYKGYSRKDILEMIGAAADTLAALTSGGLGFGHDVGYWRSNTQQMEFFVHCVEYTYADNFIARAVFGTKEIQKMQQFVKQFEYGD